MDFFLDEHTTRNIMVALVTIFLSELIIFKLLLCVSLQIIALLNGGIISQLLPNNVSMFLFTLTILVSELVNMNKI